MYETEINKTLESSDQLPINVIRSFENSGAKIRSRTVLPWSEHCTECVWPTCYSTCDLYSPRPDGKCRRFVDGMVRVDIPSATNSYLLKIRFKRWGKLWTPGNVRLHSLDGAQKIENRDRHFGKAIQKFPLPSLVRITATKKRYSYKKRSARSQQSVQEEPTCFLLECYNPEYRTVRISVTMRPLGDDSRTPYQKLLELTPGFHLCRIPLEEITALVDVRGPFDIEVVPNDDADETTLYFGLMDFALEAAELKKSEKKIKCIVWDLDNTLWDGILVEDGIERLRLKPEIKAIIQALDARGILNSIASKNNVEDGMRALKQFGLEEYLLCPQISWHPKSQGIQAIAKQLNIGLDTLLFVDDSKFELEEVKAVCPEVHTVVAEEYRTLLDRSDCQVPVTDESKERRKLYQVEMDRQEVAKSFSNDYMAFLQHCQIRLHVRPMAEESLERVHELTQRTNQMNFSGNRYDRSVLKTLLSDPNLDTFVLSCEDRFGNYGVIGFSIVDRREPRMTDLMFSCRVQSKRVEHAFLAYLLKRYIAETGSDFFADYRKTPRNAPSGQVFSDIGMEEVENRDGVFRLRFPKDKPVPDDGVIELVIEDCIPAATQ